MKSDTVTYDVPAKTGCQATPEQVAAASALVTADLSTGVLQRMPFSWDAVYQEAVALSRSYTASTGCR